MRILISGFEPFGGQDLNPTALLIQALKDHTISYPTHFKVEPILLPVDFKNSFEILHERIQSFNPDVIIALGQAAGRDAINLESTAVNSINATIPDNRGEKLQGIPITLNGAHAYISTLPNQGIEAALKSAGIAVKISNDAGEFVCNYLFYRMLETNQESHRLCGFIHVPLLPEQMSDGPTMPLDELKRALSVIFKYIDY